MEFKIKTLTPIWTGDINNNSKRVKPTGMLGSMRWWYEGIIRGLGGYACDPNSESRCDEERESPCLACNMFGMTGWQRQFRLDISNINTIPLFFATHRAVYRTNGNWLFSIFGGKDGYGSIERKDREIKFKLKRQCLWKPDGFTLKITPLTADGDKIIDKISYLLDTIAKFGALGAKTQNGFGQIKIDGLNTDSINNGRALIKEAIADDNGTSAVNSAKLFNLNDNNFFSLTFTLADSTPYVLLNNYVGEPPKEFKHNFVPCAFDIRYKSSSYNPRTKSGCNIGLRPLFEKKFGKRIASELLGNSKPRNDNNRSASRVFVSHLYKENKGGPYQLKIWGYIPSSVNISKQDVIDSIKDFIMQSNGVYKSNNVIEYEVLNER